MRAHGFSLRCQRHGAPHSNRQAVSAESCNPRSLLGLVRCLDRWTVPPEKGPRCGTKKWGDFSWHFFPKKKVEKRKVHPFAMKEQSTYTTWKVDGATPMYWVIMAPY